MSHVPFYMTRAGRTFYERTMPGLVRELARLNETLEKLLDLQSRREDRAD